MKTIRHLVFALLITGPLILSNIGQLEAALWHSPSGHYWTIDSVCRNGVKITMMERYSSNTELTLDFVAYQSRSVRAEQQPQKHMNLPPVNLLRIGNGSVTEAPQSTPLYWADDETGKDGKAYVYGSDAIYWDDNRALPIGRAVLVKRPGDDKNFIGAVTGCWI